MILSDQRRTFRDWVVIAIISAAGAGAIIGILAVVMLTVSFLGAAVELILHPSFAFGGLVAGLAVAVFNAFVGLRVRLAFRRQRARVA